MLFLVSGNLLRDGLSRLSNPTVPEVTAIGFLVLLLTVTVNLFVYFWENRAGHRLKSEILINDSLHTRSDILVSLSVIGTLIGIRMGIHWLDVATAVVIAGLILKTAVTILVRSSGILCDRITLDPRLIEQTVMDIPRIRECHKVRTRGKEDDIHIDLHVLVDEAMSVSEAHSLACQVEGKLKKVFPGLSDVLVHIEPGLTVPDRTLKAKG